MAATTLLAAAIIFAFCTLGACLTYSGNPSSTYFGWAMTIALLLVIISIVSFVVSLVKENKVEKAKKLEKKE